jgi:hypothetical protein
MSAVVHRYWLQETAFPPIIVRSKILEPPHFCDLSSNDLSTKKHRFCKLQHCYSILLHYHGLCPLDLVRPLIGLL